MQLIPPEALGVGVNGNNGKGKQAEGEPSENSIEHVLKDIVQEGAKYMQLLNRAKSYADDGSEEGVERVICQIGEETKDSPVSVNPAQFSLFRLFAYVNNKAAKARNSQDIKKLLEEAEEKAAGSELKLDEGIVLQFMNPVTNLTEYVARNALTEAMNELKEYMENGQVFDWVDKIGNEMGKYGVCAEGVKDIIENIEIPEKLKEQVQVGLNYLTFKAYLARVNYYLHNIQENIQEKTGLGCTTEYVSKIEKEHENAKKAGKLVDAEPNDLPSGLYKSLTHCVLVDLRSVKPEDVLTDNLADKMKADYDAMMSYAEKAELDDEDRKAFEESVGEAFNGTEKTEEQEAKQGIEKKLCKGVIYLALDQEDGKFDEAYQEYKKFCSLFIYIFNVFHNNFDYKR